MAKRLALLICTKTYQDPRLARLGGSDSNPYPLAALLRDHAVGNFDEVELLIDRPAEEIRQQIANLFHRRKRHDVLLLYFWGHGLVAESGQLYLAATDTILNALAETAIPAAFITGQLDRSFSRQQILVLDCAFGAVVAPGKTVEVGRSAASAAAFKGSGHGRTVLTATDLTDFAWIGEKLVGQAAGSHFTDFFRQGLRSGAADADGDGQVAVRELYQYIQGQLIRRHSHYRPRHWSYQAQDCFIIARNPRLFKPARPKWDLIFGAIMAPTATIAIGGQADLKTSIGMAGLLMLIYAGLYLVLD
jgi:hypothetical protein